MLRKLAHTAALACLLFLGAAPTRAEYPERSITFVVAFAAGGFNDVIARIVADHMAKTLGRRLIIENDAGAGGTTATRRVAQAPPDGYTIMAGSMGTHGAAPAQYPNLKYDAAKDFTPIGLTIEAPAVIVDEEGLPDQHPAGVHRLRQEEPGQGERGPCRRRLADAYLLHAAAFADRHQDGAHRVSRCGARRSTI